MASPHQQRPRAAGAGERGPPAPPGSHSRAGQKFTHLDPAQGMCSRAVRCVRAASPSETRTTSLFFFSPVPRGGGELGDLE